MPPISNYTAVHDEFSSEFCWVHDELEEMRVEVTRGPDEEFWRVQLWNYAKMRELGPLSKNKEDMRMVAVKWMRGHPEGWEPKEV